MRRHEVRGNCEINRKDPAKDVIQGSKHSANAEWVNIPAEKDGDVTGD